ncbi:sigma-54-dependent transcriptional regulator [Rhizobium alvei]|uniref:DNA-binding transcriptional regulator NtrC n=1 Tax=Rhizobium alvei TaxID=1132659 RepID=A0ABT8YNI8_9HYPH|nr:sigma-54 dependent transcriptional regulator [Rhizobium alvei]MDO6965281.1 sigma-54 dependent transcriptional regulator [Rhizobium alvei]
MTTHVLLIDDDPVQRRLLKHAVERIGHVPHLAENGRQGLEMLAKHGDKIGVIILDLMMPEMNGIAFLNALREQGTEVPVIVQTGQGGIETVVMAMRAGAFDFVVKPVSPERIGSAITNALKVDNGQGSRSSSRNRSGVIRFDDIVAVSPAMARVMELSRRAAQSDIPVVLEGESGVGKEMVARAIQSGSERAGKPFITVNCGAIPHNLVESILFGHEKGAFTGATEKHIGKFAEADGGTLFLDEIGDLPLEVQVKLLRAIQNGEIETIGARRPQKVDVRLISATNKDLIAAVKAGEFREDLYYRLNVFPITIPALRRRKEDIPVLARTFVERFAASQKLARVPELTPAAMALLTAYDWPGNIRQLENTIFRAVVLAQDDQLNIGDFPQIAAQIPGYIAADGESIFSGKRDVVTAPSLAVSDMPEVYPDFGGAFATPVGVNYPGASKPVAQTEGSLAAIGEDGEVRPIAELEEELIRFALRFYRGQMSEVARRLGIGRSTLYRKLKDYGIDPDNPLKQVEPETA